MTPKQIAELSQGLAAMRDAFPAHWRSMYAGMVEEGFSEPQAMDLLKHYIAITFMPRPKGDSDGPANSD